MYYEWHIVYTSACCLVWSSWLSDWTLYTAWYCHGWKTSTEQLQGAYASVSTIQLLLVTTYLNQPSVFKDYLAETLLKEQLKKTCIKTKPIYVERPSELMQVMVS